MHENNITFLKNSVAEYDVTLTDEEVINFYQQLPKHNFDENKEWGDEDTLIKDMFIFYVLKLK
jgi:hypothetical protein